MYWNDLRQLKRFTPINNLSFPKYIIKGRPLYYLGNGFLISFTNKMYKIDGNKRCEYGEEGEYALNAYFFQNRNELEMYFKFKEPLFDYGDEFGLNFEISEGIRLGSTFKEINKLLRNDPSYQDGETRALRNGAFQFQNSYISCNNYNYFFFEKSYEAPLTGFQYTFLE